MPSKSNCEKIISVIDKGFDDAFSQFSIVVNAIT